MQFKQAALASSIMLGIAGVARADPVSDIKLLKQLFEAMQRQNQQQIQQMQERIDSLVAAQARSTSPPATVQAATAQPSATPMAPAQQTATSPGAPGAQLASPVAELPGDGPLTAHFLGAYATLYGNAHLSLDWGSNGLQHITQVSSNESFLGVRGGRSLGDSGISVLFQIETLAEISGTPTAASGLSSRNSFVGFGGAWGRLGIGKFDTPYKRATAPLDPFFATLGDYNSIMGNTAGEGRTEFDYRSPHAIF